MDGNAVKPFLIFIKENILMLLLQSLSLCLSAGCKFQTLHPEKLISPTAGETIIFTYSNVEAETCAEKQLGGVPQKTKLSDMASVGLLLLLTMLSSIFISTETIRWKKVKENFKTFGRAVKRNRAVIRPFINTIPVVGPYADAIFNLATTGLNDNPNADLIFEFENVNLKLDEYLMEQKWDTWASGLYYKLERDIDLGWDAYKVLLASLKKAKDTEKQKHEDEFMNIYSKYEPATKELHNLLKEKETTFTGDLGGDLAEHLKCHEKDIIEFTEFINKLICKGNMMNEYYYKLKNIGSAARTDELNNIAKAAASAMFEIQRQCLIDNMGFAENDVRPFIDKSTNHDDLAEGVRSFLDETYDRYDWMVVAFITKNSKFKHLKFINKHVLSGFTDVTTELVTVALARQVKGTHNNAQKVREAIPNCFTGTVQCDKVAETLSKCGTMVAGIPVSQTYTAVHAYTGKAHQSTNAKEAKGEAEGGDEVIVAPENPSAQAPYIYTGECKKSPKDGKFVVMIKSDEEMMGKNNADDITKTLCPKLDCGRNRGECVRVDDMFLVMCKCNYPYYGRHCESDINNYRTELEKETRR